MKRRWIQINGELVPADEYVAPDPKAPYVMPDIQPYQSMIDGSMITSRSRHRVHLRDHNCIEVGNELPKPRSDVAPPPPRETLLREFARRFGA